MNIENYDDKEWARLPRNGEKICGLSRAAFYRMMDDPGCTVIFVSLRKPGSTRGTRLVSVKSVKEYIAKAATAQMIQKETDGVPNPIKKLQNKSVRRMLVASAGTDAELASQYNEAAAEFSDSGFAPDGAIAVASPDNSNNTTIFQVWLRRR